MCAQVSADMVRQAFTISRHAAVYVASAGNKVKSTRARVSLRGKAQTVSEVDPKVETIIYIYECVSVSVCIYV